MAAMYVSIHFGKPLGETISSFFGGYILGIITINSRNIIGGTIVGLSMLDVTFVQYIQQTVSAVSLNSLFGGLFKSIVYGSLVAIAGCQQGMACGSSALAVGQCTTKAVVMGIVLIVISAVILTVIYVNLGI